MGIVTATKKELASRCGIKTKSLWAYVNRNQLVLLGDLIDINNPVNRFFLHKHCLENNLLIVPISENERECYNCRVIKSLNSFPVIKRKVSPTCAQCLSKRTTTLSEKIIEIRKIFFDTKKQISTLSKKCSGCLQIKHRNIFHGKNTCQTCCIVDSFNKKEARTKYRNNNKPKAKIWRQNNKPHINNFISKKKKLNPVFALSRSMRGIVNLAFRIKNWDKAIKTKEVLGCDFEQLKIHLESQFKPGMTWENRGEWHIDHKMPLATAKNIKELIKLNHYTNLQPLWAIENLQKGARVA